MHEFALADAVIRTVQQTAGVEGLESVTAVVIEVGELQQIQSDLFGFALREVCPADDARLASTRFEVVTEAARFRCRPCGRGFLLAEAGARDADAGEAIHFVPELAHAFLRCPDCRSPDFEVVAGRGVGIRTIEGELDDA